MKNLLNKDNQLSAYTILMKSNSALIERKPWLTIPVIIYVTVIGIILLAYRDIVIGK